MVSRRSLILIALTLCTLAVAAVIASRVAPATSPVIQRTTAAAEVSASVVEDVAATRIVSPESTPVFAQPAVQVEVSPASSVSAQPQVVQAEVEQPKERFEEIQPQRSVEVKIDMKSELKSESTSQHVTSVVSSETSAVSVPVQSEPVVEVKKTEIFVVPETRDTPLISHAGSEMDEKAGLLIYFGIGMNFVAYNEELSEVNTSYRDLRGPALNVGAQIEATESLGVQASYHSTPLRFENSSVALQALESKWNSIALEGTYKTKWSEKNEITYIAGIQVHQMPLAVFETDSHAPRLREIQLLNISVGASDLHYLNRRTRASILGRFQFPIAMSSSSGMAKFSSAYMFDGSVGLEKQVFSKAWVGLFWYGQYQQLHFTYRDPLINTSGTQSALFSDLELRLTFDF